MPVIRREGQKGFTNSLFFCRIVKKRSDYQKENGHRIFRWPFRNSRGGDGITIPMLEASLLGPLSPSSQVVGSAVDASSPQVDPFQQQCQFVRANLTTRRGVPIAGGTIRCPRHCVGGELVTPLFKPLVKNRQTIAIPPKHLQPIATVVAKHEQMAGKRIFVDHVLDQREQAVESLSLMWRST